MILFDRKKALTQILGPLPDKEGAEIDPLEAIASEAIEAAASKNTKGFIEATRAMFLHFGNQGPEIPEGQE